MWWRRSHGDSDAELDNTHLMRLAGWFARRVKACGAANDVPVVFCKAGQRKHRIAAGYLAAHEVGIGSASSYMHDLTGHDHTGYSLRQAAYDLRKLRGKQLVDKPARTRRYRFPSLAARNIAALLTLRPGHRPDPGRDAQPPHGTQIRALDPRRRRLRTEPHRHDTLFTDLALETPLAA